MKNPRFCDRGIFKWQVSRSRYLLNVKQPTGWLKIRGAAENNLKQVNVDIPLGIMTCVTGVSGSGKSSLINEVLYKTSGTRSEPCKSDSG